MGGIDKEFHLIFFQLSLLCARIIGTYHIYDPGYDNYVYDTRKSRSIPRFINYDSYSFRILRMNAIVIRSYLYNILTRTQFIERYNVGSFIGRKPFFGAIYPILQSDIIGILII